VTYVSGGGTVSETFSVTSVSSLNQLDYLFTI
jgi:hypothetical protein